MPRDPQAPLRFVHKLAAPVAGAEVDLTPRGLGDWRIMNLALSLVTSATVANRTITLTADDGTDVYFRAPAIASQAASLTGLYTAYEGSDAETLVAGEVTLGWPDHGLWLPQGAHLRTQTDLIEVDDQYGAVVALVEEYPYGPDGPRVPSASLYTPTLG